MSRTRLGGAWHSRRGGSHGPVQRFVVDALHFGKPGAYSHRSLLTGWASIGLTGVLVLSALFGYAKYRSLWDGIKHVEVSDLGKRPPKYNNASNLLVIGSDSRSGKNGSIGGRHGISGQRSDTVMIVHISPGR